jgi:DnaJ-class molecular chaperone
MYTFRSQQAKACLLGRSTIFGRVGLKRQCLVANPLSWFSNGTSFGYPKAQENNPFDILGIPKASSYESVKRRFVELALKHHPDVSENDDEDGGVEEFIRLREAFEAILENADGTARLMKNGESSMSDDEFQAWFYEETGHNDIMFRMDLTTRKEVIEAGNTQSQGGLDHGGIWEMARSMAEQEESLKKQKKNFKTPVALKPGSSSERSVRRRRRRKGK